MNSSELNVEKAVDGRYSAASKEMEPELCCPVNYDDQWLQVLPEELIRRDYGCGDPARHLVAGDHVLDLGSGGGKICYIASQVVGPQGHVTGVDVNDDMLTLARQYQGEIAQRIGWDNVAFHKGRIQDLQLDLEQMESYLQQAPANDANSWQDAQQHADQLRRQSPMIATNTMDVVVSNCVLNLVKHEDRLALFDEIYRVLKPGGRAVISDIVCDTPVPKHLQDDPTLWSGCISGAFEQTAFLTAFSNAGFLALEILERQAEPWKIVEGIGFRSLTLRAWKEIPGQSSADPSLPVSPCCEPSSDCC